MKFGGSRFPSMAWQGTWIGLKRWPMAEPYLLGTRWPMEAPCGAPPGAYLYTWSWYQLFVLLFALVAEFERRLTSTDTSRIPSEKDADTNMPWSRTTRQDGTKSWDMILAILENQHVAVSWDGYQLRSSSGTTMHGLVMIPVHTTTVPDPTKKRYSIREEEYWWRVTGIHWIVSPSKGDSVVWRFAGHFFLCQFGEMIQISYGNVFTADFFWFGFINFILNSQHMAFLRLGLTLPKNRHPVSAKLSHFALVAMIVGRRTRRWVTTYICMPC